MLRYMLDTNICIYVIRTDRKDCANALQQSRGSALHFRRHARRNDLWRREISTAQ
jgi:predicted nucleic acid-binding protein